jgi:hypothetical protein
MAKRDKPMTPEERLRTELSDWADWGTQPSIGYDRDLGPEDLEEVKRLRAERDEEARGQEGSKDSRSSA